VGFFSKVKTTWRNTKKKRTKKLRKLRKPLSVFIAKKSSGTNNATLHTSNIITLKKQSGANILNVSPFSKGKRIEKITT